MCNSFGVDLCACTILTVESCYDERIAQLVAKCTESSNVTALCLQDNVSEQLGYAFTCMHCDKLFNVLRALAAKSTESRVDTITMPKGRRCQTARVQTHMHVALGHPCTNPPQLALPSGPPSVHLPTPCQEHSMICPCKSLNLQHLPLLWFLKLDMILDSDSSD